MTPTDPSPADVVGRLRPSWASDEAVSRAAATAGPEVREAVTTFLVANNSLKADAADLITTLQARAEKAEVEVAVLREALSFYRDGFAPKIAKKPTPGASGITFHPTEALLEDCGNRALAALANKETENV